LTIRNISAVTFAVRDMRRSIQFYQGLGFQLIYGDAQAQFATLQAGQAFVNLVLSTDYEAQWWGRAIFRVDDADAQFQTVVAAGLKADPPSDAAWGERFFHVIDPDGHELSFAQLLRKSDDRSMQNEEDDARLFGSAMYLIWRCLECGASTPGDINEKPEHCDSCGGKDFEFVEED
jgi:catechol 2,3-dioxygenase-like lactoylglutathione lyase family enzyme/DNA-directed RNA polymerase subunit RPC12/RpoP